MPTLFPSLLNVNFACKHSVLYIDMCCSTFFFFIQFVFFKYFFGVPNLATCIFLFFYNELELGVGIDPGMALTPLSSSIGQGLNPQPSDREPSALPLDHGFRLLNILSSVMK
jgi:hypothetical protein